MQVLDKLRNRIQEWDEKELKTYLIVTLSAISLVLVLFVAFYLKRVSTLKKQIHYVNEKREEVKTILDKYEVVDQQEKKIDALLEEKGNFKIREIDDVFKKLNLIPQTSATSQTEKDATYREASLKASFSGITMKQLCDLLEELEKNKLVYTKDLEITRAKQPQKIDVVLTLATLQKKSQQTETTE
jgi:hypothetical protein